LSVHGPTNGRLLAYYVALFSLSKLGAVRIADRPSVYIFMPRSLRAVARNKMEACQ
jgi:hypothetical protein